MADSKMPKAGTSSKGSDTQEWSVVTDLLSLTAVDAASMVDDQVKHLGQGLKEIAAEAVRGKMGQSYFNNLKEFSKLIAYDGFNPLVILRIIAEKANSYNTNSPTTESFDFTFEGIQFSLKKRANLNEDVAMLCTVFLTRGNNLFKILKTISKDSKAAISSKMVIYGIKSDDDSEAAARKRKERVVLASTDVTLSRIAATFPQITLAIAKQHCIEGKASLMAIQECYKLTGGDQTKRIPHVLQHGLIAALLSRSSPDDESALRDFCYMFNLEQSMTLQPPNVKKMMIQEPITTHIESSIKFVQAAINGPMNSDVVRKSLRKGLLEGPDKDLVTSWITAGSTAWMRAQTSPNYAMLISGLSDQVAKMSSASFQSGE